MNETSVKSESIEFILNNDNPYFWTQGNAPTKRGGDGILSPKKIVYIEGDFYTPLGYDWVMESICKHIINTDNPFNWTSGNDPKEIKHIESKLVVPIYRYYSGIRNLF